MTINFNLVTRLLVLASIAASSALTGCGREQRHVLIEPTTGGGGDASGSGLSEVSFLAPRSIMENTAVTGYTIEIKPESSTCDRTRTDTRTKEATVSASLRRKCNYTITLEFGTLDALGTKLEKVLATNRANAVEGASPLGVTSAEMKDKPELKLNINLHITADGRAAGLAETTEEENEETSLILEVVLK